MKLKKGFLENGIMQGDMVVWMIFLLLCMVSVIEVYSASSNMTYKSGEYWRPILEHGSYVLVGIGIAWLIHRMPLNVFKLASTVLLHISYILLIIVLFGEKINGAARWDEIMGISYQPSEITKVSLVVFIAFILAHLRDGKMASATAAKIVACEVGLSVMLIVTENASTAGIIFLVSLCICFYGKVRARYLAWVVGLLAVVAIVVGMVAYKIPESTLDEWRESKVLHRVPVWVHRLKDHAELPEDPMDYDLTSNIQVTHAQIAVATCNIVGRGPGNSVQRDYLPQAFSDFIYAIIIEEGGFLSGVFVMFLYLLLMWRAMKIAGRCKTLFPAYLVMGLALMMVVQAMVNMAVAVGAFPVTGQPLPLISKGGTSTFVNCAYIGMILSVSRRINKKQTSPVVAQAEPTTPENDKTA